jgi:hypothetical protein
MRLNAYSCPGENTGYSVWQDDAARFHVAFAELPKKGTSIHLSPFSFTLPTLPNDAPIRTEVVYALEREFMACAFPESNCYYSVGGWIEVTETDPRRLTFHEVRMVTWPGSDPYLEPVSGSTDFSIRPVTEPEGNSSFILEGHGSWREVRE